MYNFKFFKGNLSLKNVEDSNNYELGNISPILNNLNSKY